MYKRIAFVLSLSVTCFAQTQIDNLNATDTFVNLSATGSICVNTYVFDTNQNMVACCSSLIGPSQPYFLSARNNLINNTITPAIPTSILLKVSGSTPTGSTCDPAFPGAPASGLTTSLGPAAGTSTSPLPQVAGSAQNLVVCQFIEINGGGFGICGQARPLSSTQAPPVLSITKTHAGNFAQRQIGAAYTVTVSNGAAAGPTIGNVTVTETVPAGLTLSSMSGTGWTCGANTCSRSDVLNAGASYPPITVKVIVAADATSPQVNAVSVSGGGSAGASATDSTVIDPFVPGSAGTEIGNLGTDTFVNASSTGGLCLNTYVLDPNQVLLACCSSLIAPSQPYFLSVRNDLISNTLNPAIPPSVFLKVSGSTPNGATCNPSSPGAPASGLTTSLSPVPGVSGSSLPQVPPSSNDLFTCLFAQVNGSGFGICGQAHVFSPQNVSLALGSGQAAAGQTVELPILISTAGGAPTGLQLDLSYDPQKLTFLSARKGDQLTNAGKDVSAQTLPNNDVHLATTGNAQSTIANGTLAFVTFRLSNQFTSGATSVTLKNCVAATGGAPATVNCLAGNVTGLPLPAVLSISKTHSGNFIQGQTGAPYAVTVSNAAGASPTSGTVTVTETVPSGLTLVSMSGTGWTCGGTTCTRSDILNGGASYPAITVTVNVASNATSPQANAVSVSGGGSAGASTTDSTVITPGGPRIILPTSVLLNPGEQVQFSVMLSQPAPSGGVFILLTVSDPTVASLNTVNVLILEGQTVSTRARVNGLAVGSATVQASAQGYAMASTQVQVGGGGGSGGGPGSGDPATIILPANVALYVGEQMLFPVSLSAPAPGSGVFVTLSVSDPAVVSLNTTNVFIVAGDTVSVRPRINALSVGTATITASAPGYVTVTRQVQVLSH